MNIFERAKQLAEYGRSMGDIIKILKAVRYDDVDEHLSSSFRRELRAFRETARPAPQ
jgi:hypothetical protein